MTYDSRNSTEESPGWRSAYPDPWRVALLAGTFVLSAIVLVVIVGGMVYLNSTYSRIREEQQEIQDMIRNRAEMLEAYEARQSARYAELNQRLRALEKEE